MEMREGWEKGREGWRETERQKRIYKTERKQTRTEM
jgi:hypothetical protein